MFVITYATAVISVAFGVTAVAFLLRGRLDALGRALALYVLASAVWIGGNAAADVAYAEPMLVLASGIAYIGGAVNLFLFLVLVDLLVDRALPRARRLVLYALAPLATSAFAFSEFAILETAFPPGAPAQIVPGPLYAVSLAFLLACLAYGLVRLVNGIGREPRRQRRMQLLYALSGLLLALFGEVLFDLLLPLLGELRFYSLGPLCSLLFAGLIAYAIARHRLLDIALIVQRGTLYALLLALVLGVYVALLDAFTVLFHPSPLYALHASALATTALGIIGAPRIERLFRRLTDPIFFKDRCDYAAATHALSESLAGALSFDEIAGAVEATLARVLRAECASIEFAPEGGRAEPGDGGLVMPVMLAEERIGSIRVGPKRSGEPYGEEDRRLLATFANHTASALARVQLYRTVERHATELEAIVAERTERIREMHESQKRLMLDLSHNLQTPLAVFRARLDQAAAHPQVPVDVQALARSLEEFSAFIYSLLSLAKRDTEAPPSFVPVDLSAIIADIAEELEVIAAARNVRIETDIVAGMRIAGDARRLREALMNVAGNALAYLDAEGERLVRLSVAASADRVRVSIADTGIGIAADELPKVFDRFYRGNGARERRGTGLGLPIAKQTVERHGGTIAIASEPGIGTTVTLAFPPLPPSGIRAQD